MKKVAPLVLILLLAGPPAELWAQLPDASADPLPLSPATERRFRKILGDDFSHATHPAALPEQMAETDEKPFRKRRKKANVDKEYHQSRRTFDAREQDETYPDYERPNHLIEMSVRFAPNASVNAVEGAGNYQGFAAGGIGLRPSVGVSLDYFFFKDRYAFSSGLWYTIKQLGYRIPGSYGEARWNPGAPNKEGVYNLQYLQLPLTVKLFANNLFTSSRLYLQTGGVLDVKLAERPLYESRNALYQVAQRDGVRRQFGFADAAWVVGAGIQYRLNSTNALNLGVHYQRGLLDVARPGELTVRNRMLSLELGFKF